MYITMPMITLRLTVMRIFCWWKRSRTGLWKSHQMLQLKLYEGTKSMPYLSAGIFFVSNFVHCSLACRNYSASQDRIIEKSRLVDLFAMTIKATIKTCWKMLCYFGFVTYLSELITFQVLVPVVGSNQDIVEFLCPCNRTLYVLDYYPIEH